MNNNDCKKKKWINYKLSYVSLSKENHIILNP
jgi:hypothetical protein